MSTQQVPPEAVASVLESLSRVVESSLSRVSDHLVDPIERFMGPDGEQWLSAGDTMPGAARFPYRNEIELSHVRDVCRWLWRENPYAQGAHNKRISYTIGSGHIYSVIATETATPSEQTISKIQAIVDEFIKANRWSARQAEIVMRLDRDGEVMLRKFEGEDGILRVRYVEPESVVTPQSHNASDESGPLIEYGIEIDRDDRETFLNYWIGKEEVPASEIQHRRNGLDSAIMRGVPLFWGARHNLTRAAKILRNGSTVTEIQTAIGMIRKFVKAASGSISQWTANNAQTSSATSQEGGTNGVKSILNERIPAGAIINTGNGIDYEFPGMGIDPSKYNASVEAELRAAAALCDMPSWMFLGLADDVNRSSALVTEGPATKNFERMQAAQIEFDLELLNRQLDLAVEHGNLTPEERNQIQIDVQPPRLVSRDRLADAQASRIEIEDGYLSPQTAAATAGYDYQKEMSNIEDHADRTGSELDGITIPDPADDDLPVSQTVPVSRPPIIS